ncbi:hypothetical protein OS493_004241 [Desmophyllum pertusum]|uniref:SCP2 domain-containing protein n=1 Tax=Desmophyllum pertusum TaxID=174260 RepID=A0A9W9ZTR3_9CNID|nr:hypothetical protein OS493_004241 [Desmophyllum pertusum]
MWRDGNRISFQCKAVESGQLVLSGAYIDLKDINIAKKTIPKVKGIFEWNVTKGGKTAGQWTVDLKSGSGSVTAGPYKQGKPDCSITVEDDDLALIATGKSNPQQLFMKGKLKVKGNIMLTTKLAQLFKDNAKM